MAELRAGGLAIIIRSPFPENVGRVVKLVACIGEKNHQSGRGVYWEVEATAELAAELAGTPWRVKPGSACMVLAKNLMPIDGDDFSNEDERQKEREHA
ncbi:hypothetical protein ACEQ9C_00010 [Klebsiella pneumoniae]|uniref:Uncharacterized protein n=1 Tax=Klebsiella pneumoniae TaxID=573 RepID=A0A5D3JW86_KLEPN|nr:hypothetical protein [Klebsiella pneumoniae]ASC12963.1 hypothetical protein AM486_19920 [Klebsiella pneumoniae]MCF6881138.1 hypothetical protein [Klebsiella pneumoniae]NER53522.1 hypothetical protein [Klebsiella pneumoniae]NEW24695.1 hypothetical protein [Klebsiella pneumoniae]NPC21458.1 hypothetical protein [Klebsiella pneumoniae]